MIENSPAFQGWVEAANDASPAGTAETIAAFCRPCGTRNPDARFNPALKGWAIFKSPFGTGTCRSPVNTTRTPHDTYHPGAREYMLRGLVTDDEIGLDRDFKSITWSGA
jgi:hypothetical protein